MYGPPEYFGPPEHEIGFCECGASLEDCGGDCYPASLLQLSDPDTGEHPLPLDPHDQPRYWS